MGIAARAWVKTRTNPSPSGNCRTAPVSRVHNNVTLPVRGGRADPHLHKAVTIATRLRLRGDLLATRAVMHKYNNSPIAKLAAIRAQPPESRQKYESGI